MILQIGSDRPTFKRLSFSPGLNLVIAERQQPEASDPNTARRTRNGAGKSSLVDVIHFIYGGDVTKRTVLSAQALGEDTFTGRLRILGADVLVSRGLAAKSRIVIDGDTRSWPIRPFRDEASGEQALDLASWKDLLGKALFGLPSASLIPAGRHLSFRSCFSYFARRAHDGGFRHWTQTFARQGAASVAVNLSFLLGLDPEIAYRLFDVKRREDANRELGKSIKEGFLKDAVGSTADIRKEIRKLEAQRSKLAARLESVNIVEFYAEYEDQANRVQKDIDDLNDANLMDRRLLDDLQSAIAQEEPPALPEIRKLYESANVALPETALRRYEEVFEFHQAIVANRQEHLSDEIASTQARIDGRSSKRAALARKLDAITGILRSGVARNHYERVEKQLIDTEATLQELGKRLQLAQLFETTRANLRVEKAEAQRALAREHQERGPIIAEAMSTFEEISSRLFDEPARLEIVYDDYATRFRIEKDNLMSEGVNSMQVFTFDLMLTVLLARRGRWPGFLIHDSHLFDGVDGRQIGAAFRAAEATVAEFGGQYIATINSDDLDKVHKETGDDFSSAIIKPVLNDTPEGGLFGFRFAYGDVMDDQLEIDIVAENDGDDET